jgi:hypothetical protein
MPTFVYLDSRLLEYRPLRDQTIGPERARICANPRICCEFVIRIRVVGTNFNDRMWEPRSEFKRRTLETVGCTFHIFSNLQANCWCTQRLVLFPQTAYASIITVLHHHQQHIATMLTKRAVKSLISDCDEEWLEAFMMFETNKTTAVETPHPSELGRRLGEITTPIALSR